MTRTLLTLLIYVMLTTGCVTAMPDHKPQDRPEKAAFDTAIAGEWMQAFHDDCTGDWEQHWFLDGKIGAVHNTQEGMRVTAGPRFNEDSHHMVLWTKESFGSDVIIEYEYTKLDFETRCVSILYVQATGAGEPPYVEDIAQWSQLRDMPAMSMYYNHMDTYHISYAAFGNREDQTTDYVRARRYMPGGDGLKGTGLSPDYHDTGLFEPGVPHRVTVVKRGQALSMRVASDHQTRYFHWQNHDLPAIDSGRIGLRQMYTRSARFRDFRVKIRAAESHDPVALPIDAE